MNQPSIRRPEYIGASPIHPFAFLFGIAALVVALFVATEYAAFLMHFNPTLGHAWLGRIYAPWAIMGWAVLFESSTLRHVAYPPIVLASMRQAYMVLAVGGAASIFAAIGGAVLGRKIYGSDAQLFDSTKWASVDDAEHAKLFEPAGPIVGGLHVPLRGVRPVRYSGDKHAMFVAGPGAGKSNLLKTNLLMPLRHTLAEKWTEQQRRFHPWGEEPNIFGPDVKGELFLQCSGYQEQVLGKDVYLLAPLGNIEDASGRRLPDSVYASFNPLWSIRIGTGLGYQDCYSKTQAMIDGEGEGIRSHWDRTSLGFGAACLEKLGFLALNRGRWEQFSLPGLAQFVSSFGPAKMPDDEKERTKAAADSLNKLIRFLKEEEDDPAGVFGWERYDFENNATISMRVKPSIYAAAAAMERKDTKERAGVYSTFIAFLSLYLGEPFQKFATTSSFTWRGMGNNTARASTVFFAVNPLDIDPLRPFIRLVLSDALEELTRGGNANIGGRSARKSFRPFWFALDEVAAFRKLREIESGAGFFRGYGIYLFLVFQSLAQLRTHYGQSEVLSETMGMMLFGRPERNAAAEEIESELGFETVVTRRRSRSTPTGFGGGNMSIQDSPEVHRVPLLTAKQIMQMEDDKLIALSKGKNFYLTQFPYFKNKALADRAKRPYAKEPGKRVVDEPTFVREARLELGEEKWAKLSRYIEATKASRVPVEGAA